MEQIKLSLRNVTHYYEAVDGSRLQALDNINLEIKKGEFVAIVGASGCGKTTMLNIMSGILKPSQGEVLLDGRPISQGRHRIGYISQTETLLPWRKVIDNIMLGPELDGVPKKERYQCAKEIMASGGLEGFERKYPFELSGGMRKRAIILRALAHDPEIIFMDEPFGPLDVFTREALQQEILRIWNEKKLTVVYISHDIAEAISLADRIIVMSKRPSSVQAKISVQLPRPRNVVEIRYEEKFIELERKIGSMIRGTKPEVQSNDK
ncbi:MAG: ABC transporter ATP-binding protein [bacterium]|nr:ABC transporter ATP-binding protein [bacterium]